MVRLKMIALSVLFFFAGCALYTTACPAFPKPSQEVLTKIENIQDSEVDAWLEKLFKLNKKLKLTQED